MYHLVKGLYHYATQKEGEVLAIILRFLLSRFFSLKSSCLYNHNTFESNIKILTVAILRQIYFLLEIIHMELIS